MEWNELMRGVSARFVMDPIPIATSLLLYGRWPEDKEGQRNAVSAAMGKCAGELLKDMWCSGQYLPIVARFQFFGVHKGGDLWPELRLGEQARALLERRLLVYEGNHRLACARFMNWEFVLVEPRLWIWGSALPPEADEHRIQRIKSDCWSLLKAHTATGMAGRDWRDERPKRTDGRPIDPESGVGPHLHGRCAEGVKDWLKRWGDCERLAQALERLPTRPADHDIQPRSTTGPTGGGEQSPQP